MKETYIMDVADLTLKRKSDGHVVLRTRMQLTGLDQSITEERLKGGIGNGTIALLRSDKEVTINTRDALFDLEYLALTQGVAVENGTATVTKKEFVVVTENATTPGTFEVTLTGTPLNNEVVLHDTDGTQEAGTFATGKVTLPVGTAAVAGDEIYVSYKEEITGDIVRMDSKKFSEAYEAQLSTIEYDAETEQVYANIYFQFDKVVPSGAFSMSLENGTPVAPEVNLMVMNPKGKTELGRIIREILE